jgi:putative transposase
MTPPTDAARYKNHRFPGEIISHGVWLYYRFPLSYRDVQELLFERGIEVTHEALRQWCLKFGQDYANQLKRRRAQPGDKWHLDEVFLTINGERHYLTNGASFLHTTYILVFYKLNSAIERDTKPDA